MGISNLAKANNGYSFCCLITLINLASAQLIYKRLEGTKISIKKNENKKSTSICQTHTNKTAYPRGIKFIASC